MPSARAPSSVMGSVKRVLRAESNRLRRLSGKKYTNAQIEQCVQAFLLVEEFYQKKCAAFLEKLESSKNASINDSLVYHKSRTKDAESLARKLQKNALEYYQAAQYRKIGRKVGKKIGKKVDQTDLFTVNGITDLGGVRLVYLARGEWEDAYKFFKQSSLGFSVEHKKAYVRDKSKYQLKDKGFEIAKKPSGYTSFHYIIKYKLTKKDMDAITNKCKGLEEYKRLEETTKSAIKKLNEIFIEVQTRSLIEDGWSELDHRRRYKGSSTKLANNQLETLNDIANVFENITAGFKDIDQTPRRINWENVKELARKAENVTILSKDLEFIGAASNNRHSEFADQVFDSASVEAYDIFVVCSETQAKTSYINTIHKDVRTLVQNIKNICSVLRTLYPSHYKRVHFWTVRKEYLEGQETDMILLEKVSGAKVSTPRNIRFSSVDDKGQWWEEFTQDELVNPLLTTVTNEKNLKKYRKGWRL